jgi:hypothetical protein
MTRGSIAKRQAQIRRIHSLLVDVAQLLANQPRGRLAYGPMLAWGFWLAFPAGQPVFLTAVAHGPDHRIVDLETTMAIATEADVASLVEGMDVAEVTAAGDSIAAWLKAPRFRRMVEVIRERTRALVGGLDDVPKACMQA